MSSDGIDVRGVIKAGAVAVALLFVVGGAAVLLARHWTKNDAARLPAPERAMRGPVLETTPQGSLKDYLVAKQQRLDGYGWVDRRAGIAHIPIDTAMQTLAARSATPQEPEQ